MAAAVFAAVTALEMVGRRKYNKAVFVGIVVFFL